MNVYFMVEIHSLLDKRKTKIVLLTKIRDFQIKWQLILVDF